MAKLPLVTSATVSSGPTRITTVPAGVSADPKVHYDTDTGTLVVESLDAPAFTATVDGLVPAPTTPTGKYLKDDGTWDTPAGGGGGIQSVTGTAPITVDASDPLNPDIGIDQTALGITASQVSGLATVATTGSASDITTGTLAKGRQEAQDMGADISGTTGNATVIKIQGNPFSNAAPVVGQTPVWNGTTWVPSTPATSGSGGGGVVYYLNKGTTQMGTGLPSPTYELGREAEVAQSDIALEDIITTGWTKVGGFVTDALDPNYNQVPPGLWTFNVWCNSTAASGNQAYFRITLYKYNGTDNPENGAELGHSDDVYMYDQNTTTQYTADVLVGAGKTLDTSDRIYVLLQVRASISNRDATFYFGDATPTHTHSTIPSVTGTGLVKVIDGVVQSPASLLLDADVASNAAITRSKFASGANNALLVNNGSGVMSELAIGGNSTVLQSNGTSASWVALSTLGFMPTSGGTFTGKVNFTTTASSAGLNISQVSSNPSSLVDGDLWLTGGALQVRANGTNHFVSLSNRFNTYAAGVRQTMSHSSSGAAGFSLGAVTGNPNTLVTGDIWHNNTTNKLSYYSNATINVLATEAFVTSAVSTASGVPYDIAGEAVGAVSNNDIVMRFFVTRAFTISAGTNYSAGSCETAPSGSSATFNIEQSTDGGSTYSTIGTLTYANGSKSGTITVSTAVSLSVGHIVRVKCSAASGIVTPWFAVRGTL